MILGTKLPPSFASSPSATEDDYRPWVARANPQPECNSACLVNGRTDEENYRDPRSGTLCMSGKQIKNQQTGHCAASLYHLDQFSNDTVRFSSEAQSPKTVNPGEHENSR